MDGSMAIFHGPRKLVNYDKQGKLNKPKKSKGSVSPSLVFCPEEDIPTTLLPYINIGDLGMCIIRKHNLW
jgi:hypothetical protein